MAWCRGESKTVFIYVFNSAEQSLPWVGSVLLYLCLTPTAYYTYCAIKPTFSSLMLTLSSPFISSLKPPRLYVQWRTSTHVLQTHVYTRRDLPRPRHSRFLRISRSLRNTFKHIRSSDSKDRRQLERLGKFGQGFRFVRLVAPTAPSFLSEHYSAMPYYILSSRYFLAVTPTPPPVSNQPNNNPAPMTPSATRLTTPSPRTSNGFIISP